MTLTVYLDLDGTLVDVSDKHYGAYADIMRAMGLSSLPFEAYWALKRQGLSPQAHPSGPCVDLAEFSRRWLEVIERRDYLLLDRLIPGARRCLDILASRCALVLVTMRRDRRSLLAQLSALRIDTCFQRVVSPADGAREDGNKAEMIGPVLCPSGRAVIVGDAEADVQAGKVLALPSMCVLTGVRGRSFLEALGPDRILESVASLPQALREMREPPGTGAR